MAAQFSLEELEAEQARRSGKPYTSQSVLDQQSETTAFDEFRKFGESTLKGIGIGLTADMFGGWGNLYDYLKKNKEPSALSTQGIIKGIKDLTGIDPMKVPGYKGAFEFSRAGAPAAAMTAVGVPGLFSRTGAGVAGEFGTAGTMGVAAEMMAPDSPLASLAIQATPDLLKGSYKATQRSMVNPIGTLPADINELLRVGRMTPGEATGSRVQLSREAKAEAAPEIETKGTTFRVGQAQDVENFLDVIFKRASTKAGTAEEVTNTTVGAFNNYGKALAGKLRKDSASDFKAAKTSGGIIDPTPVLDAVNKKLSEIPPETPGFASIESAIKKIKDEYFIPEVETVVTPTTILGPTGQPAGVSITPGTPAGVKKIDVERLQKNLSAWGQAVYSGTADFGKGNIFEGVAPGQVKGIAIAVLNGFRQSLDEAIDAGVPGAEKLKGARDNFKNNLNNIEIYSNRPLTKYFDVANPTDLTPEAVLKKLKDAQPSERKFLAEVLQNNPQGSQVFDSMRKAQFTEILTNAANTAAKADDPAFNLQQALVELNKKKGDFDFLFPSSADKSDANLAIRYLQKVLKSEGAGPNVGMSSSDVYAITGGAGGSAQARLAAKETFQILRDIIARPNVMADVVFDPETVKALAAAQKQSTPSKIADVVKAVGKVTATQALRSSPRLSTTPATVEEEQQPAGPEISEAEAEAARRGLKID
jgi:hypothetical protein